MPNGKQGDDLIKIEIKGGRFLGRASILIKDLERDLNNLDLSDLTDEIAAEVEHIFERQGSGWWNPLTERYRRWKDRHYPGQKKLRLTDTYFTAATTPGSEYNVITVRGNELEYGVSGLDYAPVHEYGAPYISRRPVFALAARSQVLHDNAQEIIEGLVAQALENNFKIDKDLEDTIRDVVNTVEVRGYTTASGRTVAAHTRRKPRKKTQFVESHIRKTAKGIQRISGYYRRPRLTKKK